jgi:hypothetical protein
VSLRDAITDDAVKVFCNDSDFAELVVYHPHRYVTDAIRPPRTIKAVVIREQSTSYPNDVETVLPVFEVHVANDPVNGISSEELDTGGDQLEFPPRDGQPSQRRSITQLTTQDHGMLVLECR